MGIVWAVFLVPLTSYPCIHFMLCSNRVVHGIALCWKLRANGWLQAAGLSWAA